MYFGHDDGPDWHACTQERHRGQRADPAPALYRHSPSKVPRIGPDVWRLHCGARENSASKKTCCVNQPRKLRRIAIKSILGTNRGSLEMQHVAIYQC